MALIDNCSSIDMSSSVGRSGTHNGSMNLLVAQALTLVTITKIVKTFKIFIIFL